MATTQPRDFGFGEEEQMVRDSVARYLADNAGIESLRALVAGDPEKAYGSGENPAPWNEQTWQGLVELGVSSLAVPESNGGAGMKMVAVAAVAEEAGRVALPSPLVATLVATCVAREADSPGASALLGEIAGGAAVSLAGVRADGDWQVDCEEVQASGSNDAPVLSGEATFVQDARKAGSFLVAAKAEAGVGLYRVAADAPGLTITPDRIVDLTRDQARLKFNGVELDADCVVAPPGQGSEALMAALPAVLVIVAADMCGAAEWQMQTTADYARTRVQFDHPLGFFQAVKHPTVNMMLDIDRARSLVYAAACAVDCEPATAERLARMAKAAASDMAGFCSGRSVQLHGGIGFTWECDLHLYFKRQCHNQVLYGDAGRQRDKLAALLD